MKGLWKEIVPDIIYKIMQPKNNKQKQYILWDMLSPQNFICLLVHVFVHFALVFRFETRAGFGVWISLPLQGIIYLYKSARGDSHI